MAARLFSVFVLAGYLAAAFLPCPIPGSAEASALRGQRAAGHAQTRQAHHAEAGAHVHHGHHDRASAGHGGDHTHHTPDAARAPAPAVEFAMTLPCPCGCGGKKSRAATGGKLGPRLMAVVFELTYPDLTVPLQQVHETYVARPTTPPEPIPIHDAFSLS